MPYCWRLMGIIASGRNGSTGIAIGCVDGTETQRPNFSETAMDKRKR